MATITGNYQIDSLLAGDGVKWPTLQGQTTPVVTYSFMAGLPAYASATDATEFSLFTEEQKAAVREILQDIQTEFNIIFTEVTETSSSTSQFGQIRFGNNKQEKTAGYAYYPDASLGESAGDVFINNDPAQGQTVNVVKGSNAVRAG